MDLSRVADGGCDGGDGGDGDRGESIFLRQVHELWLHLPQRQRGQFQQFSQSSSPLLISLYVCAGEALQPVNFFLYIAKTPILYVQDCLLACQLFHCLYHSPFLAYKSRECRPSLLLQEVSHCCGRQGIICLDVVHELMKFMKPFLLYIQ